MIEVKDVSKEIDAFVTSRQFKNFEVIMDAIFTAEIQKLLNDKDDSHGNLIANRKIANAYRNLPLFIRSLQEQNIRELERKSEINPDLK